MNVAWKFLAVHIWARKKEEPHLNRCFSRFFLVGPTSTSRCANDVRCESLDQEKVDIDMDDMEGRIREVHGFQSQ